MCCIHIGEDLVESHMDIIFGHSEYQAISLSIVSMFFVMVLIIWTKAQVHIWIMVRIKK